jgi:hypothetical protein
MTIVGGMQQIHGRTVDRIFFLQNHHWQVPVLSHGYEGRSILSTMIKSMFSLLLRSSFPQRPFRFSSMAVPRELPFVKAKQCSFCCRCPRFCSKDSFSNSHHTHIALVFPFDVITKHLLRAAIGAATGNLHINLPSTSTGYSPTF